MSLRRARSSWSAVLCALALLLAGACQASPPTSGGISSSPTAEETATAQVAAPAVTEQPPAQPEAVENLPTAVVVAGPLAETGGDQALQRPLPSADPLRFIFPTPGPAPVSAWRPPLYPTPWAPTPFDHFYFARPIGADEINWPLADYRYGGVFFDDVVHTGVDIPAPRGTSVLAAGPGKVTWAGYGLYALKEDRNDPYGLAVAIRHDFGYQGETLYTIYGHMQKIFVAKGQRVEGGDLLGEVGDTGKVTGVHLHFEVRVGKDNFFGSRNPELWMAPPQGWGVLAGRVMGTGGLPLQSHLVQVHSFESNQYWDVKTYGKGSTNSDPYYNENLVMGDLPAGRYELWIAFAGIIYNQDIQINPGMVTYFTFRGRNGFHTGLPPTPGAAFTPPPAPNLPKP